MCNWRTRTAGVYRTRAGSQAVLVLRLHIGLRQALSSAGPRDTAQRLRFISIPPCIYYQPRIISQSSTQRKKKNATNSFQCSAWATIHNPLAIRLQSQNQPAIKERKRPEYIEPDRGSGAVRVLPLRPDSEIARHRESRVFHNPTPDTTPFPPRSQPQQYPNTIQSNRGASPRNTNPPSPTKNAIPMQSRCNP